MWLFTKYGFFSVVLAKKVRNGQVIEEPEPNSVMIRARRRKHLDALILRFSEFGNPEVLETRNTDYRYRAVVPRDAYAQVAKALATEVDYTNFKSECAKAMPDDQAYQEALHNIWGVHYQMQELT
tara:strand:- start:1327 stop:1701 length:375 start_codon:yes stop_codon:yes gene_type:complete